MNYCNYTSVKQWQNTIILAVEKKAVKGNIFSMAENECILWTLLNSETSFTVHIHD